MAASCRTASAPASSSCGPASAGSTSRTASSARAAPPTAAIAPPSPSAGVRASAAAAAARRQPLRVHQPRALGRQVGRLDRIRRQRVDVGHELLELGAPAGGLLAPRPGGVDGAIQRSQAPPQPGQAGRPGRGLGAGEGVERPELRGRRHQPAVLALPGESQRGPRERRHGLARGRLPVDQRAGAPLGRHAPRDHDLALVVDQVAQGRGRVVVLQAVPEPLGELQRGLHQGVLGAGPDRLRVGRRPGQQAQRLGQHGLPRPGLAGDRGQAGRRGQLGPLDHDQPPDLQRPDHGRPNFSR